jgi:protein-S-isoprenylcysteine O-methyltransferase Ste14
MLSKLPPWHRILLAGLALIFGTQVLTLIAWPLPGTQTTFAPWSEFALLANTGLFLATLLILWLWAKSERWAGLFLSLAWVLMGAAYLPYYFVNVKLLQRLDYLWLGETGLQIGIGLAALVMVIIKRHELASPAKARKLEFVFFLIIGTVFAEFITWLAAPTWSEVLYLLLTTIVIGLTLFIGAITQKKPKLYGSIFSVSYALLGILTLLFLNVTQNFVLFRWSPWLMILCGVICLIVIWFPRFGGKQTLSQGNGFSRTRRALKFREKAIPDEVPCETADDVNQKLTFYRLKTEPGYEDAKKNYIQQFLEFALVYIPWKKTHDLWIEGQLVETGLESEEEALILLRRYLSGKVSFVFKHYKVSSYTKK